MRAAILRHNGKCLPSLSGTCSSISAAFLSAVSPGIFPAFSLVEVPMVADPLDGKSLSQKCPPPRIANHNTVRGTVAIGS